MKGRIAHIVVAAGSGSRFGSDLPKQFCLLAGRPVVMHAVDALRSATPDPAVVLVVAATMEAYWNELCLEHPFDTAGVTVVHGGSTRWESVRNGLAAVPADCTVVSVHDGARPLVPARVVLDAVEAVASGVSGAVPAVPVTDSIRQLDAVGARHGTSVDRRLYVAVQTPQVFDRRLLDDAYGRPYREEFTDDASVMEAAGYGPLLLTTGSPVNIKITNPDDLALAEVLAQRRI